MKTLASWIDHNCNLSSGKLTSDPIPFRRRTKVGPAREILLYVC